MTLTELFYMMCAAYTVGGIGSFSIVQFGLYMLPDASPYGLILAWLLGSLLPVAFWRLYQEF